MWLSDESIRNLRAWPILLKEHQHGHLQLFCLQSWQELLKFPSVCPAPGVCLRRVTSVIRSRRTWFWQGLPTNQLDPVDNQGAVLSFYPWKTQAQEGTLSLLGGAAPGSSLVWPGNQVCPVLPLLLLFTLIPVVPSGRLNTAVLGKNLNDWINSEVCRSTPEIRLAVDVCHADNLVVAAQKKHHQLHQNFSNTTCLLGLWHVPFSYKHLPLCSLHVPLDLEEP